MAVKIQELSLPCTRCHLFSYIYNENKEKNKVPNIFKLLLYISKQYGRKMFENIVFFVEVHVYFDL